MTSEVRRIVILTVFVTVAIGLAVAAGTAWVGLAVVVAGLVASSILRLSRAVGPVPRTLVSLFVVTAGAVGALDYFVTSTKNVAFSAALGIGCGALALHQGIRAGRRRDATD